MRNKWKWIYWIAGAGCLFYWLALGMVSRFGLSLHWMWPAVGTVLIACGFLCRSDRVPRWLRIAWRAALALGLAALLLTEGLIVTGMREQPPEGLDWLIVLGARVEENGPSPALRHRIDAAAEYMARNPETKVIASGGQGADEPISEAECIRRELENAGIAPERIYLEDRSGDTAENLRNSRALVPAGESVGIITNNYHVYRAVRLARAVGFEDVHGLAAEYTGGTIYHFMIREAICIWVEKLLGNL